MNAATHTECHAVTSAVTRCVQSQSQSQSQNPFLSLTDRTRITHCPALTIDRANEAATGIGLRSLGARAASCRATTRPLPPIRTLIPTEPEEAP